MTLFVTAKIWIHIHTQNEEVSTDPTVDSCQLMVIVERKNVFFKSYSCENDPIRDYREIGSNEILYICVTTFQLGNI